MSLEENERRVVFQEPREENISSLQIRSTVSPPWLGVEVNQERAFGAFPPISFPFSSFCEPAKAVQSKAPPWPSALRKEIRVSQEGFI